MGKEGPYGRKVKALMRVLTALGQDVRARALINTGIKLRAKAANDPAFRAQVRRMIGLRSIRSWYTRYGLQVPDAFKSRCDWPLWYKAMRLKQMHRGLQKSQRRAPLPYIWKPYGLVRLQRRSVRVPVPPALKQGPLMTLRRKRPRSARAVPLIRFHPKELAPSLSDTVPSRSLWSANIASDCGHSAGRGNGKRLSAHKKRAPPLN